jgi:2-amino-4-hydroxy-6-hydroxymethyldihydropteridine diphosphokinase
VDVLLLGDVTLQSGRLVLPHPELRNRRFVVIPLGELAPELSLPPGEAARVERVGRL